MSAPNGTSDAVEAEPGFKVFAGNLTYATDEKALRDFFSAHAKDIIACQIIFHGPRSAGYGFVTFNTAEGATKACNDLDKKELDGRPVIVERAKPLEHKERKPKRQFGGRRGDKSVPGEAVEGDNSGAAPAEGTEKPKKKRTPKKRGPKPTADGEVSAAANGEPVAAEGGERAKKPRKPRAPKRPRGETPAGDLSKSVLFVANLAFSVDEAALTQLFTENGITVTSARVVRWRWGTPRKSKGYAFVDVGTEAEQKKALQVIQGKQLAEREITVKIAVNSIKKEDEEEGDAGEPVAA